MRGILALIMLIVISKAASAQQSYFTCNKLAVYLTNGSVTIELPKVSKEKLRQQIHLFIKERNYVYKPYYSGEGLISFRDFAIICNKNKCGSDLIAMAMFHFAYDSGFVKITLDNEIYSSFYGGELIINDNDDVASKKDVPFAPYEFQIPEQYSDEYPESIYVFNKRGKIKIKNPDVEKVILDFFNRYIVDIRSYFEQ